MSHQFTVAARNGDGVMSLWRMNSATDIENARTQVSEAIASEEPFKAPGVVLVGITGGKP